MEINVQINELLINEGDSVINAMKKLDETGRTILFVAPNLILKAVVTDADIRRFILKGGNLNEPVSKMANYNAKSLKLHQRSEAKQFLLENAISAVPLLDNTGKIADIIFAGGLDIDIAKKANCPVVIMAGGLGTRLYPYTKILPKPLIPIGELPIVEHIIDRFSNMGCGNYFMVVNYKKNMIKSYFNDLQKDYTLEYIDEDTPLGTGGGLSLLKGKINETFFFTNCDILIDADYGDIYKHHKEKNNIITMVCAVKNFTIPYGVIQLKENGEIDNIKEKPEMNFLTNTGLYVVEPCVINELESDVNIGFPDVMEKYRQNGQNVGVYPVSEQSWMDMGQLEEMEKMRRRLEKANL